MKTTHRTIAHLVFPNAKMATLKKPKELFSATTHPNIKLIYLSQFFE
jgi:hypothetical protein